MSSPSVGRMLIHIVFPFITLAGLYAIANLMINSGHAQLFDDSRASATPVLSDGKTPLLLSYTGIPPLDSYLANLQFSLIPTVDGSSPALSLLGWHWMGLLIAVFTVMLLESLRARRASDLIPFVLWGLAIQYPGYFVAMPLYCYVHLLSRTDASDAKTVRLPSSAAIRAVPISVLVGLVLPTVAMCLPSRFHSGESRQVAIAVWQNFPVWMAAVQLFAMSCIGSGRRLQQEKPENQEEQLGRDRSARRRLYEFTAVVSAVMHILGLAPIVLATIGWPEGWVNLQSSLRSCAFFLPRRWDDKTQISGMPDGAFNFLRYDYYIGTVAALAWVVFLQFPSRAGKSVRSTGRVGFWDVVGIFLLGPGFTIVNLMDRRDSHENSA